MNVATEGEESGDVHDLNQNNEGSMTGSIQQSEDDLGLLDSGGGTMINHSLESGEGDNNDLPPDYLQALQSVKFDQSRQLKRELSQNEKQ